MKESNSLLDEISRMTQASLKHAQAAEREFIESTTRLTYGDEPLLSDSVLKQALSPDEIRKLFNEGKSEPQPSVAAKLEKPQVDEAQEITQILKANSSKVKKEQFVVAEKKSSNKKALSNPSKLDTAIRLMIVAIGIASIILVGALVYKLMN